jgi:hypothetical protein
MKVSNCERVPGMASSASFNRVTRSIGATTFAALPWDREQLGIEELFDLLERRPSWHGGAVCRTAPASVDFFPQQGDDLGPAKAVCSRCPVCAQCGAWAAEQGSGLVGMWGGRGRRERRSTAREAR